MSRHPRSGPCRSVNTTTILAVTKAPSPIRPRSFIRPARGIRFNQSSTARTSTARGIHLPLGRQHSDAAESGRGCRRPRISLASFSVTKLRSASLVPATKVRMLDPCANTGTDPPRAALSTHTASLQPPRERKPVESADTILLIIDGGCMCWNGMFRRAPSTIHFSPAASCVFGLWMRQGAPRVPDIQYLA